MTLSRLEGTLAAALALAVLIAFFPSLSNDFVPFDDVTYILDNPQVKAGLTPDSMAWAFSSSYAGNWHPLTWLSHQLDVTLFGLDPLGHHATSLLLHLLNTLLVFAVLLRMTGQRWASFAAAALFGLHPLRVESVVWISERKDVLSGLFWLLTMAAYLWRLRRPSWPRYALVLAFFALGLCAKSMLVTLPFALLLLDYWPLRRTEKESWRSLILEKTPFFLLSGLFCGLAVVAQGSANALNNLQAVSLGGRLANALTAYVAYVWKTLFPTDLIFLYPFPGAIPLWKSAGALALLLATTLLVWLGRKRWPFLLVGWLWLLGVLAPVIGLVQIGLQSMADRYTYIPSLGLSMALVWSADAAIKAWPRLKPWLVATGLAAAVLLTGLTRQQARVWKDGEALFSHAVERMPEHTLARFNLAGVYATRGDHQAAAPQLQICVAQEPWNGEAWALLGESLLHLRRYEDALPALLQALRFEKSARLLADLAQAYAGVRQIDQAAATLEQALRLEPRNLLYWESLALLRLDLADPDAALAAFQQAAATASSPGEAQARRARYAEAFRSFATAAQAGHPDIAARAQAAAQALAPASRP